MRFFSKASEYAFRVLMQVISEDVDKQFSPKDICDRERIPEAFARKALQELARARILRGTRGPGGGYRIDRELSKISLLDIVVAVDGPGAFDTCPMGLTCEQGKGRDGIVKCDTCPLMTPNCGLSHVCPMHRLWKEARTMVLRHLESTTLQDILDRCRNSALEVVSSDV